MPLQEKEKNSKCAFFINFFLGKKATSFWLAQSPNEIWGIPMVSYSAKKKKKRFSSCPSDAPKMRVPRELFGFWAWRAFDSPWVARESEKWNQQYNKWAENGRGRNTNRWGYHGRMRNAKKIFRMGRWLHNWSVGLREKWFSGLIIGIYSWLAFVK